MRIQFTGNVLDCAASDASEREKGKLPYKGSLLVKTAKKTKGQKSEILVDDLCGFYSHVELKAGEQVLEADLSPWAANQGSTTGISCKVVRVISKPAAAK